MAETGISPAKRLKTCKFYYVSGLTVKLPRALFRQPGGPVQDGGERLVIRGLRDNGEELGPVGRDVEIRPRVERLGIVPFVDALNGEQSLRRAERQRGRAANWYGDQVQI